jgi:hypothetical protein
LISSLSNTVSDQLGLSSNEKLFLNLFWGAFTVYAVSNALVENPHLSEKLSQYLQLFSLIFIFISAIFLIKLKFESDYLKTIFLPYFLWLIIIVIRGIQFDFK